MNLDIYISVSNCNVFLFSYYFINDNEVFYIFICNLSDFSLF